MPPLINILIRTSGRPNLFRRCIESVIEQDYPNVRVIVGSDNAREDLKYIEAYPIVYKALLYAPGNAYTGGPWFYNKYCNLLLDEVGAGFCFFLDDDDTLAGPTVLTDLAQHLTNDYTPVVCQMLRKGKPRPTGAQIDTGVVLSGWCGLPCMVLPWRLAKAYQFNGATEDEDWRFIKYITQTYETKFVRQVVVETDRRSYGSRVDMLSNRHG